MFYQNDSEALEKEDLSLEIYHEDNEPLGLLLQRAGLVSEGEILVALEDQKHHDDLMFGQILAMRGWVKQETADFFATHWHEMIEEVERGEAKYRLGECLQRAGLLNDLQIREILELQKTSNQSFGQIAVQLGYIKETTLNLFVEHFCVYDQKYLNEIIASIVNSAQKLVRIKKYSLAILELRKALKYNPHHSGTHALLGIIYLKQKQLKMAQVHIKKAERSNPNEYLLLEAKALLKIHDVFNNHHHTQRVDTTSTHKKSGFFSFLNRKLTLA